MSALISQREDVDWSKFVQWNLVLIAFRLLELSVSGRLHAYSLLSCKQTHFKFREQLNRCRVRRRSARLKRNVNFVLVSFAPELR